MLSRAAGGIPPNPPRGQGQKAGGRRGRVLSFEWLWVISHGFSAATRKTKTTLFSVELGIEIYQVVPVIPFSALKELIPKSISGPFLSNECSNAEFNLQSIC
jgi:hypothetical protein